MRHALILALSALAGAAQAQSPGDALYAPQGDWAGAAGQINWSTYTFRDWNGNGVYDFGDTPLAAVATAVARDDIGLAIVASNANGFGNFKTLRGSDEAVINTAGTYSFAVVVPPGWRLTTGNGTQTIEVADDPESSTGLRLTESITPIGLAPYLTVSGTYGGEAPAHLSLAFDGEEMRGVDVRPGERFRIPAGTAEMTLSDGTTTRAVAIGQSPVDVGVFGAREHAGLQGRLITFEDLAGYELFKLPNGYQGLNWHDLNLIHRNTTPGSQGYVNGASSGHYTAYTTNTRPGEIDLDSGFDLISIEMSVAWRDAEGQRALIEAWSGDRLVASDSVTLSVLGPVTYAPALVGITRLRITPEHGWQIVIDDLRVNTN
jgi:hypothetical protein